MDTAIKCTILIIAISITSVHGRSTRNIISQDEGRQKCVARTGLTPYEIISFNGRNENCAFDCATRQGTIQTYFAKDNTPCHDAKGYRCLLGKCQGPDVPRVDTNDLYETEIRIISAHVPDMDQVPSKGESDTFVVVKMRQNGHPTYVDGEVICHTYTVVDDAYPMWKNFVCKPLPIRNTAILDFYAWDSDKPIETPDSLGLATESLEYLLNRGPTKLRLVGKLSSEDDDYHVVVDVKGREYNSD